MQTIIKKTLTGILLCSLPIFTIPGMAWAQDSKSKTPAKKTKIRIEKDVNGKKTVFDTTFEAGMSQAEIDKILKEKDLEMKELDGKMKDLDRQMKDADDQMKRIEVYITNDSADGDSAKNITKRIIINGDHHNFRIKNHPNGYEYEFEMPEIPEIPEIPELEGFEGAVSVPMPPHVRVFNGRHGQSLNDVLGDIPMSSVRNYKIKETKHGKRIIIDVDDDAMMGQQQKVIVITKPPRAGRPSHSPRPHREIEEQREIQND